MSDPTNPSPATIGQRVTEARNRRGLTQMGLAQLSHYSRSHIAQVEKGHKAATPSFVTAVAAALGVDPAEIYGQPYRGDTAGDDRVHASIGQIRRALAFVDIPPDLDAPPRTLDRLEAELATCQRLRRAAHHTRLGARLPGLLEELTYHVYDHGDPRAWRLLFGAFETTGELTRRLGYNDLANQILDRSSVAAANADDPHLPLMVIRRRALLMANVAAYQPALKMLTTAAGRVDPAHPGADEAEGSLHLRAAIIAARTGHASTAWKHYGEARRISRRAGNRPLDRYITNFVPGNLLIHGTAVAVELRDWDEVAHRSADVTDEVLLSVSRERQAHHRIDVARAHDETGHRDQALAELLAAERAAPQMTRFHPMAKAAASHLATCYRDMPEALRGLMSRMRL
jgi:transcriptional regulator with XRE-family HTH domain